MGFAIASLRLNRGLAASDASSYFHINVANVTTAQGGHDSHPDLGHLVLLVFEAVMQVVCVSLPGYIIARLGHFDADKQKFLANLNVMLFTPCLIFTKLASQLNADKLVELGIIPLIFVVQILVSLLVSRVVAKSFGFGKRASNFVTAMGVFGNSNSLPISLVISLSQTLRGLHWDRVPGDNDEEVAARGILYLLIFQQLGQLVRWSWGYHVLLAPKDKYEEYNDQTAEEGRYRDDPVEEEGNDADSEFGSHRGQPHLLIQSHEGSERRLLTDGHESDTEITDCDSEQFEPAGRTPIGSASRASPADSGDEGCSTPLLKKGKQTGNYGSLLDIQNGSTEILSFPRIQTAETPTTATAPPAGFYARTTVCIGSKITAARSAASQCAATVYANLPAPIQATMAFIGTVALRIYGFAWDFMNPPLWAMLFAITVASIPELQKAFFEEGSFVKNSLTSAVKSSGGVAVPLILVVLGANLARNTESHPEDESHDPEEERIGNKLLVASLVSRMVLPTLIMAPLLALIAKYVSVSILDDPIFIIVCFLLTGAPSALQLAQICQINMVFENVMAKILFQSYVIWILPSTLILVMSALEVLEWSK